MSPHAWTVAETKVGIVHRDLKPGSITLTKSGAKLPDTTDSRQEGLGQPEPCKRSG
jgi:serine/threonine protein kinase